MNEQLTLITNDLAKTNGPQASKPATRKHKNPRKRADSRIIEPNASATWWKLSKEEKELGLAGVRSIRSILQKYSPNDNNSIAKAS